MCVSVMSRIEAETRNVQALVKAGSLEDAASSACGLFEMCQEAGLLVRTWMLWFPVASASHHTAFACT